MGDSVGESGGRGEGVGHRLNCGMLYTKILLHNRLDLSYTMTFEQRTILG